MAWPKLQGDNVVKIGTVGVGFPFFSPLSNTILYAFWLLDGCKRGVLVLRLCVL